MICPTCGSQVDQSQNVCPRCGNRVRASVPTGPTVGVESTRRGAQSGDLQRSRPSEPLAAGGPQKNTSSLSQRSAGTRSEAGDAPVRGSGSLLSGGPLRPCSPGTSLQKGRYRLQELLKRHPWGQGAFEATWTGRDFRREKSVRISEVAIPEEHRAQILPTMHAATMALLSVRQTPHIVPLIDAFSDQGRSFFVFEAPVGETLAAQMRRVRHPLTEQTVVHFCLQMTEVLEVFHRKSPALAHGLISPEHISQSYDGQHYTLSDFSVFMAGRASAFLSSVDRVNISPYVVPEFSRDPVNPRNDLYSLVATAYHLATGNAPSSIGGHAARSLNPELSAGFEALLVKGLHPMPQQRYQQVSQLRQDLQALRTQGSYASPVAPERRPAMAAVPMANEPARFSPSFSSLTPNSPFPLPIAPLAVAEEEEVLLPAPETLPPLSMGNEILEAGIMLAVILAGLGIVVSLSHFHV